MNVLGAGDAFASGFFTAILQGWPARKGGAGSAIAWRDRRDTRHGCANFMPTIPSLEFLESQRAADLTV